MNLAAYAIETSDVQNIKLFIRSIQHHKKEEKNQALEQEC